MTKLPQRLARVLRRRAVAAGIALVFVMAAGVSPAQATIPGNNTQTYGSCYLSECYRATVFVEGDSLLLNLRGNTKIECYRWYNNAPQWYACPSISNHRVWLNRNGTAWLGSGSRSCSGNCTHPYYNSTPWGANAAGSQQYQARLGGASPGITVCTRNRCYSITGVYSLAVNL